MGILAKMEALAQHLGVEISTVWEAFEAFIKQEIAKAEKEKPVAPKVTETPPAPPAA
jgi:hypothetical protein